MRTGASTRSSRVGPGRRDAGVGCWDAPGHRSSTDGVRCRALRRRLGARGAQNSACRGTATRVARATNPRICWSRWSTRSFPPSLNGMVSRAVAWRRTCRGSATDGRANNRARKVWRVPWAATWRRGRPRGAGHSQTGRRRLEDEKRERMSLHPGRDGPGRRRRAWRRWTCCCRGDGEPEGWWEAHARGRERAHSPTGIATDRVGGARGAAFGGGPKGRMRMNLGNGDLTGAGKSGVSLEEGGRREMEMEVEVEVEKSSDRKNKERG